MNKILYNLRRNGGLTVEALCRTLQIAAQDYYAYELHGKSPYGGWKGVYVPAQKLSDFFKKTIEEIWGPDTRPSPFTERRVRRNPRAISDKGNQRLIQERWNRQLTLKQLEASCGINLVHIIRLESMTDSPVRQNYQFRTAAKTLAKFYERDPHWLFAEAFVRVTPKPFEEIELDEGQFAELVGAQETPEDTYARKELLELAFQAVNAAQSRVILQREQGWKLDEIGAQYGLSKERIRQIDARGLERMRAALEKAESLGVRPGALR